METNTQLVHAYSGPVGAICCHSNSLYPMPLSCTRLLNPSRSLCPAGCCGHQSCHNDELAAQPKSTRRDEPAGRLLCRRQLNAFTACFSSCCSWILSWVPRVVRQDVQNVVVQTPEDHSECNPAACTAKAQMDAARRACQVGRKAC